MLVFLDFEASSLSKQSYPIKVAWVFEDGRSEEYLIRPAPAWTDWDPAAEAIHHIRRATLLAEGTGHELVARLMVDSLTGHDLLASAPSWDGKWLSALLRAAGLPRHSLRLRDSDDAHRECAEAILSATVPSERLAETVAGLLAQTDPRRTDQQPIHRALADARAEYARWLQIRTTARAMAGLAAPS